LTLYHNENNITPATSGGRVKVKARNIRTSNADFESVITHAVEIECKIRRKLPANSHLNATNVARRMGRPNPAPFMSPSAEDGF